MSLFIIQHPIIHTQMYPVSSSESGGKSVFPLVLSQFHVDMLQTGLLRWCWLKRTCLSSQAQTGHLTLNRLPPASVTSLSS